MIQILILLLVFPKFSLASNIRNETLRKCAYVPATGAMSSSYYKVPSNVIRSITNDFASQIGPKKLFSPCMLGNKEDQHIVVFGGSMTGGAGCVQGSNKYKERS